MDLARPGRPGALIEALAVLFAVLLVAGAGPLLQPVRPAGQPARDQPVATIGAIGAAARLTPPGPTSAGGGPGAPDPAGPDTPGLTSLVSTWSPAATTTVRGADAASSSVNVAGVDGFAAGDSVVFGVTLAIDSIASIDGTVINLGSPLTSSLPIGTSMVRSVASASSQPAISANGRFVAYASTATTIVPGVGGGTAHIYEFDRTTGITRLVSGSTIIVGGKPQQVPPASQAIEPSVNADGSLIAYVIVIPAVVGAAVVPGGSFVIVHDNSSGNDVELAPGSRPSISGSGALVALETTSALVPALDANKLSDVYLLDRASAKATLVSAAANGHAPAAPSGGPSLAANGGWVAFTSAGRLVAGDHDPAGDVYVRNLAGATTSLVSVHGGADAGASSGASISADGRYVAFSSRALTLVGGPLAGGGSLADLYVRDVPGKKTVRLSRAIGGGPADGASNAAAISGDGRTIAFASSADNLVPGDTNLGPDVFLVDRLGGRISRASIDSADQQAGPASGSAVLSQDASVVAFQSTAQDLAPAAHGATDVYLRVRFPKASVTPPALAFPARPVGSASPPELVTVHNVGAGPLRLAGEALAGPNPAAFLIATDGCAGASLEHGESCTIAISFQPAAAGTSLASLVVTDNDPGGSQTVSLGGGTLKPTIVLDPLVGPGGFVTRAIGTSFPPGATVTLNWSVGLTASMPPVIADASGSFAVQVLILPRDTLGQRILTGTFSAAGGGSAQSLPFLVVPGTGQPPFDAPRIPGQPPQPVFRR